MLFKVVEYFVSNRNYNNNYNRYIKKKNAGMSSVYNLVIIIIENLRFSVLGYTKQSIGL